MFEPNASVAGETRARLLRHLEDLHRLHLALLDDSRALKTLTAAGHARLEIELLTELLEQYLSANDAFLENMRNRVEARLGLLRRSDPAAGSKADSSPEHGAFWLAFSRLGAALRRAAGANA